MTDEARVMSRVALPEETQLERQLRPQRLDEYVGHLDPGGLLTIAPNDKIVSAVAIWNLLEQMRLTRLFENRSRISRLV